MELMMNEQLRRQLRPEERSMLILHELAVQTGGEVGILASPEYLAHLEATAQERLDKVREAGARGIQAKKEKAANGKS